MFNTCISFNSSALYEGQFCDTHNPKVAGSSPAPATKARSQFRNELAFLL